MSTDVSTRPQSEFTGGAFAYFFRTLAVSLVSSITFGLLLPTMICWQQRWVARHTYINGRQQVFDGKGIELFGKYLLWLLLTIVTLGIFMIWLPVKVKRWTTKHTHFVDGAATEDSSYFDGSVLGHFGRTLLVSLVSTITFGLGIFWGTCYLNRWLCSHTVIDGERLSFDGKGINLFGKYLLWTLLTIVTFGIFGFWLPVKELKWMTSHTNIDEFRA